MVKPLLYLFDDNQTYDFLWFSRVDNFISYLLNGYFGNHAFFDAHWNNIVLMERFTPDNYEWADSWLTQLFPFIKTLSRTFLVGQDEINGRAYGFIPEYQLANNLKISLEPIPDQVSFKVKAGERVVITWMERAYSEGRVSESKLSNNYFSEWMKRYRVFEPSKEDVTVNLDCKNWLFNSCVISAYQAGNKVTPKSEFTGITNNQKELILYEFLESTISKLEADLKIPACSVLTGFDVVLTGSYNRQTQYGSGIDGLWGWLQANFKTSLFYADGIYNSQTTIIYTKPRFQEVPSSYYYAYLNIATNNYWGC